MSTRLPTNYNDLRWYGHVLSASFDTVCEIGRNMEKLIGNRLRNSSLKIPRVDPDQAFYREKWCYHTRRADPATKRFKRWKHNIKNTAQRITCSRWRSIIWWEQGLSLDPHYCTDKGCCLTSLKASRLLIDGKKGSLHSMGNRMRNLKTLL